MTCPACTNATHRFIELAPGLDARECSACGGIWIPGFNYARYLERNRLPAGIPGSGGRAATASPGTDTPAGKDCPDCGKALVARKVGTGFDFAIERCDHCFGIWLDRGEWQALAAADLAGRINYVFSRAWQAKVADQAHDDFRRQGVRRLLDPARAAVAVQFMDWLDAQAERDDIRRYL